jgi:DNA-binding XRE family transcriptional regulator
MRRLGAESLTHTFESPEMAKFIHLDEVVQPAAILFGKRLKIKRQAKGLTQAELAEVTGITAAYISVIERGRANPSLDMLVKLAEAIGEEAWDMIRPASHEDVV